MPEEDDFSGAGDDFSGAAGGAFFVPSSLLPPHPAIKIRLINSRAIQIILFLMKKPPLFIFKFLLECLLVQPFPGDNSMPF